MKRKSMRLIALTLAAALAVTGCGAGTETGAGAETGTSAGAEPTAGAEKAPGGGNSESAGTPAAEKKADAITDWISYITRSSELETFFILGSERTADFEQIGNLYEGLLETDEYAHIKGALAEDWGTEDGGKTWTFKLREGVKWVDMNGNPKDDLTAQDWITGLEWVLNFHKNAATNTSMPIQLIEGAEEYYNYTKEMEEAEALALDKSKFLEMVGIEAPDAYTLKYTCTKQAPYFYSVALCACLYPLAQGFIDEVGVENVKACSNENMWYNGCYTCTEYIQNNEKIFTKNPLYWDQDALLFDSVTIKVVESGAVAYQLYQAGEVDSVTVNESTMKMIMDTNSEYKDQLLEGKPNQSVYNMVFNYEKHLADGSLDVNWNTAAANKNFRKALYYGLDITPYLAVSNSIHPLSQDVNTFTAPSVCFFSDGRDYTEAVMEKVGVPEANGVTIARYDKEKAEEYKKLAMEELSKEGVTFPVTMDYFISASSQTSLDKANVLKQVISDGLGDMVQLNINTYVSSLTNEVYKPKLQSFNINGWGADYADPLNFLGQHLYDNDSAYYSNRYTNIMADSITNEELLADYKTFTEMVEKADMINDDMDARYDAFAEAEAFWIDNALSIPFYQSVTWSLSHSNTYSKPYTVIGCQKKKYKNWETSKEAYTTAQMEQFKAQWESERSK